MQSNGLQDNIDRYQPMSFDIERDQTKIEIEIEVEREVDTECDTERERNTEVEKEIYTEKEIGGDARGGKGENFFTVHKPGTLSI